MPVLDGNFEAFVTNLGRYNEGALVGEWVKFPTTAEELKKVFERIGIGEQYEEWFITDYECPIHGIRDKLGEYESLDKLNYLAGRIDELPAYEQEKFIALMESGCDEVGNLDDIINLTYNLDSYDFISDVSSPEDLGYHYVHDAGTYPVKELGALANYIDYEQFGRDVAADEGGKFTDDGYVRHTGQSGFRYFDGTIDDIPDEYRLSGSAERSSTINVLKVEYGKEPYAKEIDAGLESLQHEVGGFIEAVYPFREPVAIVCNEEGKCNGMPLNRALRDRSDLIYDVIAGDFLVVGLAGENFTSLSDEQMKQYAEHFKTPETLINVGGRYWDAPKPEAEPPVEVKEGAHTVDIYQLKDSPETAKIKFMNLDYLQSTNRSVNAANYDQVYSGSKEPGETLEGIYERFNLHHPADFRGHSLSVSDVVVLREDGKDTAYFVDSYGFKEVPEFFKQLEVTVTMNTENLAVAGHIGTWHTIDQTVVGGETYSLMEHDIYADDTANIIVDAKGKLVLDELFNGFDAETIEQLDLEQMSVARLPDDSITTDEMKNYGYAWGGMLPLREEAAAEVMKTCTIYRLYGDNTEGMVEDSAELKAHAAQGGIFGVEKVDWMAALERENYLKSAELSTKDDYGMIDGIINNGPKEEPTEKGSKTSIMDKLKSAKADPPMDKPKPAKEQKNEREL